MPHREMLRLLNADLIRAALRESRMMNKRELAERTGLPLTDISRVVDELLAEGELREEYFIPSEEGASSLRYSLNRRAVLTLLLRLEGDTLHWAVHDLMGGRLDSGDEPCRQQKNVLKVIQFLVERIRSVCPTLRNAVFGLPCRFSEGKPELENCPADLKGVDIPAYFKDTLRLDVLLENNIKLAATGYLSMLPCMMPETIVFISRRGKNGLDLCSVKGEDFTCAASGLTLPGQVPPLKEFFATCADKAEAYGALIEEYTVRYKPDRVIFYSDSHLLGMENAIQDFCERHLPLEARLHLSFLHAFDADHESGQRFFARRFLRPVTATLPVQY